MELRRGNTARKKFQRKNENGQAILTVADNIYFTVKYNDNTETYLFQKKLSNGSITFTPEDGYYHMVINPEDTENLPYRDYTYDVKRIVGTDKKTIGKGILSVMEATTSAANEVSL